MSPDRPALGPGPRPGDAARLLSRLSGSLITEEMLREDAAAGAATNSDGTRNPVHYAAWLLKEMGRGQ